MTGGKIIMLVMIALAGHAMALLWLTAARKKWKICERTIYDLPIDSEQIRREIRNSIHTPIHAVFLTILVAFGFFENDTVASFALTLVAVFVWAEIWHYASHRAFHIPKLHWIHLEHHKSRLNSPFTAISFSFSEKLIFDIGILLPFCALDGIFNFNFYGIAAWFLGYLLINSFSHANFEFRALRYNAHLGKIMTTTAYHALHHSRYTGNYGLGTRVLDRALGTEWSDYEAVYDRVCTERRPLTKLRERLE